MPADWLDAVEGRETISQIAFDLIAAPSLPNDWAGRYPSRGELMLRRMLAVLTLATAALTFSATAHADTTYRGRGDDVVRIRATKTPGLIHFTHKGTSNFIVHSVTSSGKTGEYLVNEIGRYDGTVLYNDYGTKGTSGLEIKADGSWTATFRPLSKARCWCLATIRGTGDQVLKLSSTRGLRTVRATHSGTSNFIVHSYTRVGGYADYLINEIGRYRGKVLLPARTRLVVIHADGAWTLVRN